MAHKHKRFIDSRKLGASEPGAPIQAPQQPKPGTNANNQFR